MPDLLPLAQKRFPLFEDIFRRPEPQPGMTPLVPGQGGVPATIRPPAAPSSLFSDDDIRAARANAALQFGSSLLESSGTGRPVGSTPGFASALGTAARAGGEGYQSGLKNAYGLRSAQQAAQLRAHIQSQYPEQLNETTPQTMARLEKIFAALSAGGDFEGAGKVGEVLKSYESNRAGAKDNFIHIDAGDRIELRHPTTGALMGTIPKGVVPKTATEIDSDLKFKAGEKNKILDDYARDTKDFHQVMAGWDVLAGALKEPSLATPFALLDAYARITNPGAIVRPTTMEMLHDMGSLGQRMRKYVESNMSGQLPPDITRDLARTMKAIVQEHLQQYKQIRGQALKRAGQAKIDNLDELLQDYRLENPDVLSPARTSTTSSAAGRLNLPSFPVRTP